MTEQGAQYDHIGSKYDEYAQTATLKRAESYTVLRMVGALSGKRVLDLACGFGFYTRLLKQQGAAQVLGVDISPEMARLGRAQKQAEPLGVTYQVCDATALPPLGAFDLVTAIYLLNYATSKDELLGMCWSAYDNLVEGGRFVAYTVNPAYTLSKPNGAKYGCYFLRMTPEEDRYVCDAEFVTDPPTPFRNYQWSQEAHERAIKEAGFRTFAWHPSEVSPEDVARYGEAYWQDFYDNCLVIGLVCQK
jgi:ubiquinone/menaquinone biosynthesis C-methylase UbiE